ncbi:laminin subunit alpha-3-like [Lampetra fluviatilis]
MTSMALSHLVSMLLLLLLLPALPSARAAGNEPSLLPPYFNVAERASASATATCGQDEEGRSREDTSCALSGSAALSGQGNLCEICSLDDPDSAHPVSNAIDGTERSWQSPPLSRGPHYNHVNVTLNLGQVGSSSPSQYSEWWLEADETQPLLESQCPSTFLEKKSGSIETEALARRCVDPILLEWTFRKL